MSTLSDQLALRIGLAALAMPNVSPACLVAVLLNALRYPLTDQKLKQVTAQQLRRAAGGVLRSVPRSAMEQALAYLQDRKGEDVIDSTLGPIVPYQPGEMPGSLRLAIASNLGEVLNSDFSHCLRFLVYQVGVEETRLVDVRGTAGSKGQSDPLLWRAQALGDCQMVFTTGLSMAATAVIIKTGIHPVRRAKGVSAQAVTEEVAQVLRNRALPPWLSKLVNQPLSSRSWVASRAVAFA